MLDAGGVDMKKTALIFVALITCLSPCVCFSETWMDDCNTCTGDRNGVFSCTTLYCGANPKMYFGELKVEWMNQNVCAKHLETKSNT